jgi:glycosyl transferase family 92
LPAYQHFIDNYSHRTEWAAIIDVDEFILLKKHPTLKEFLEDYGDVDAVAVNLVFFGDSGHFRKPDGLVMDSFLRCGKQDELVKTIARAKKLHKVTNNSNCFILRRGSRYVDVKGNPIQGPFHYTYTVDVAQINHYWTKSYEEFLRKCEKGLADGGKRTLDNYETNQRWMSVRVDTTLPDRYSKDVRSHMESRRQEHHPHVLIESKAKGELD